MRTIREPAARVIAGIFAIFAIVTISGLPGFFGWFPAEPQVLAIGLLFVLTLVYLSVPADRRTGKATPLRDALFLAPGLIGAGFAVIFYESKIVPYTMFGYLDTLGILMTAALVVSLMEALRRVIGWVLPALILLVVAMTYYQEFLPGLLHGTGFELSRLTFAAYVGGGGIFGTPFSIAMSIIIVFIIFGSLLERSGGGQWFMDVAYALTGWSRGGTAKTSVVASAFFGSVSGSPSGNTATTGAVTIPAMRRSGYSRNFSGAVEAVASTGGMILPPVMGAVAFIMADLLGTSYAAVVTAAVIPALLYFIVLFASVHFRALRQGMSGMPRKELPPVLPTFLKGWRYWVPIVALTYFLVVMQLSPGIAGLYALPFLVACSFFTSDRNLWLTPGSIWTGLVDAVFRWRLVAVVTAAIGIMLGALNLSGLGVKISSFIVEIGGGNLLLTLLLVGVASIILGMGLDIVPLYLTLVVLTAPALTELGLEPIQAHLFVVFWGLASFITPPVCNAVFAACAVSGGSVWRTGGEAMRLGAAVFLVSFAFALSPALMLDGGPTEVLFAVSTALLGAFLIAAGLQGYGLWSMSAWQRTAAVVAGAFFLGHV